MRFLCLHGAGTSAAIFSAQTAAFRAKLDPTKHTFDFIDAPHAWHAGPGIKVFFQPPYYSFWTTSSPREAPGDVEQAHELLLSRLHSEHAPYDAVLCFSQGCAVAVSLILLHNNEHPEQPLPFRAAVFICGGVPLPILADRGMVVSPTAWAIHERTSRELWQMTGMTEAKIAARRAQQGHTGARPGLWDNPKSHNDLTDGSNFVHDPYALPPLDLHDVYGLDITRVPESFRLNIPTVNIYGRKDPRCTSALQLALMCAEDKRLTFDHGGGHEIPRDTQVSEAIAAAIDWLEDQLSR